MNDRIGELREELRGRMHDSGIKTPPTEKVDHILNSTARDIAEQEKLAATDSLTGLVTRRVLDIEGDREIARHQREHKPLAAIMLDVDHFKNVNDQYGHSVGDQVLKKIARTLEETTRHMDVIARYGGEEFVILMPEATGLQAKERAEKIRRAIEEKSIDVHGKKIKATATFGVTQLTKDDRTSDHLINRADQALYRGKNEGRNKVVLFL